MKFNIFISETLLIPILICQILFLETDGLHVSYTVGFNTNCVDDKLAFLQIIQIALDQCVVECARRKKCRGISYRERFTLCNLIDVDNPPYSTPVDCVLVNKNHMKYQLPQTCKDCENCDIDTEQCIVTECPKLTLTDGTLLGNMNSIGNRVKYTCNHGFKREKEEAYATCQQNGLWSLTPRCVIDICFHSPRQNGGTCISTIGTEQYTCTCKQGFTGQNCDIGITPIILCEHSTITLSCPAGKSIDIKSANYGRTYDETKCPSSIYAIDCRLQTSLEKVRSECFGKIQCQVSATNAFFGTDPCSGVTKYLEVDYICT